MEVPGQERVERRLLLPLWILGCIRVLTLAIHAEQTESLGQCGKQPQRLYAKEPGKRNIVTVSHYTNDDSPASHYRSESERRQCEKTSGRIRTVVHLTTQHNTHRTTRPAPWSPSRTFGEPRIRITLQEGDIGRPSFRDDSSFTQGH